jgi:hypothetical protein
MGRIRGDAWRVGKPGSAGDAAVRGIYFERVKIMGCQWYEILPVEVYPRVAIKDELRKSFNALVEGDLVGGELAISTKWCSVCPAAYFKCCTRQAAQVEISSAESEEGGVDSSSARTVTTSWSKSLEIGRTSQLQFWITWCARRKGLLPGYPS